MDNQDIISNLEIKIELLEEKNYDLQREIESLQEKLEEAKSFIDELHGNSSYILRRL